MASRLLELRQRVHDLGVEGRALTSKAKLTPEESARLEALDREYNDATTAVIAEEAAIERRKGGAGGAAQLLAHTPDGKTIRLLRPNESMAEVVGHPAPGADLGGIVRGMVTGQWPGEGLQALGGTSTTGGGILLSPAVSATVIDLARSKSRVIQAGAITVPMGDRELVIAKVTGNPSAAWRAESKAIPVGDLTFGAAKLTARTLGVIVRMPVELVEDASNLQGLVEGTLSEVIALELDRVALVGSGAGEEPRGLQNTPSVETLTSIGSPVYDDFTDAVTKVRLQNGEPTGAIVSPRDIATLEKLKAVADGQYLIPPKSYSDLPKYPTNQVPVNLGGGTNESLAFVGDWEQLWVGIRTQLTIEASRQAASSSGSAFENLELWIRGYIRADIVVVRPAFFTVMSGVTA